jgi:hypothetical protein
MRRPRLQFRLSTLLWITLAVACFFGGMRVERWLGAQRDAQADIEYANDLVPWRSTARSIGIVP